MAEQGGTWGVEGAARRAAATFVFETGLHPDENGKLVCDGIEFTLIPPGSPLLPPPGSHPPARTGFDAAPAVERVPGAQGGR